MRILITIHHTLKRNSGAPGADLALAEALRGLGHTVDLLSHDDLPAWAATGRVSQLTFPVFVLWRALRDRKRYDVLDYLSCDGCWATLLPKTWRPRVLAMHSHGLEHLVRDRMMEDVRTGRGKPPSWKYRLFRGTIQLWTVARGIRGADVVFLLNRFERAYVCDAPRRWASSHRVHVTFNGVADEIRRAAPAAEPVDDAPLGIAFVGTFIERKGVAYLLPALEAHLARYPAATALLLGTQRAPEEVLRGVRADVRGRIRVVSDYDRADLPALLSHSHVFVLPSLGEGFSLAFIEAMSLGLVPVVTRGHGFEEGVEDGRSGILIDRGSTEQIVRALDRLETDRPAWRRMRADAIESARRFSWDRAACVRADGYRAALDAASRAENPVH